MQAKCSVIKSRVFSWLTLIVFSVFSAMPFPGYAATEWEAVVTEEGAVKTRLNDLGEREWMTEGGAARVSVGSFNQNFGETWNFQLGGGDLMVNVNGGDKTVWSGTTNIFGGILGLFNVNGIHFTDTSRINLTNAGFIGAAMRAVDGSTFNQLKLQGKGYLLNEGQIRGGNVALLGGAVENRGMIEAPLNEITLAGGKAMTVGLSPDNLISVVVTESTDTKVKNFAGTDLDDQIKNSGNITGHKITLDAKGVDSVFEKAINLTGEIKAVDVDEVDGELVMMSLDDVYSKAILEASRIYFESDKNVYLSSEVHAGSIEIADGTAVHGGDAKITVARNWSNEGAFEGDESEVEFLSDEVSHVTGDNRFHDLTIKTPQKEMLFEAGKTQTVTGEFKVEGAYGQHVKLLSTVEGLHWKFNPVGSYDISYAWVQDAHNLGETDIVMRESTNRGNSILWDPTATWTNGGGTGLWSTAENWSGLGGALPGAGDDVVFDSTGIADSFVDVDFGGIVGSLSIGAGYSGALTLNRSLALSRSGGRSGSLSLTGGTFNLSSQTLSLAGSWNVNPGRFNAGTGTVDFNYTSGTQSINGGIASFYNLTHSGASTLSSAYSLNVSNNLINSGGDLNPGNSVSVSGLTTLSGGTYYASTFNTGGLTIDGGIFTKYSSSITANIGDLTLSSGTLILAPGTFNVSGNWTKTGGTFTPGTNTVTFTKSSGTQTLNSGGSSFYTIDHTGAGTLQLTGSDLAVTNLFSNNSGSGTFDLNGRNWDMSKAGGGNSFFFNNGTIQLRGTETITSLTQDIDSGRWMYVGDGDSASDTINIKDFGATDYAHLVIASTDGLSDTFRLNGADLSVAGGLTVSSGIFNANTRTVTNTGGVTVSGGTYQASSGTQTFNGGLNISSGTFTGSTGAVDVNGNVTLSGGTLTAPSGAFTVSGNWTKTGGTFTPGTGTVTFDAGGTQTLNSGGSSFYNLTHSNNGTLQLTGNPLTVTHALTNSTGTFDLNGQNLDLTGATLSNLLNFKLRGNETISGLSGYTDNGTWVYSGDGDSAADTYNILSGINYKNLTISATDSSDSFLLGADLTLTGNFTLSSGAFDTQAHDLVINGDYSQTGGAFNANDSLLRVDRNFTVSGGDFNAAESTLEITALFNNNYGFNGIVRALISFGGYLIAGGSFSSVNGVAVNNIAKWDGGNWTSMGTLGGSVLALAAYNGNLMASIFFGTGFTGSPVRQWDGEAGWTETGTLNGARYLNSNYFAPITVYNGSLIGAFDFTPPNSAHNAISLFRYNGSSWDSFGGSFLGTQVRALLADGTNLYVGGDFTYANNASLYANGIAKWDGSSWSALGGGLGNFLTSGGGVWALAKFNGSVVAAGTNFVKRLSYSTQWVQDEYGNFLFDQNGNPVMVQVGTWTNLGTAPNSRVMSLVVDGNNLYAGGTFTSIGGGAAASVAKWNGSSWSALGSGVTESSEGVYALGMHGSDLFIGGGFSAVNNGTASNIAKWDGSAWSSTRGVTFNSGNAVLNNLLINTSDSNYGVALTGNLQLTGNLTVQQGHFATNRKSVTFSGSGTQSVSVGGVHFYNLVHSGTGTLRVDSDELIVDKDLTQLAGTFDANDADITADSLTVSGGTYQAKDGAQDYDLEVSGGTYEAGTGSSAYGDLTILSGTYTGSSGAIDLNGNLTQSGGTFNAPTGTFLISGDWDKSGGNFNAGLGTVTFDKASGTQTLNSDGSDFRNIHHSGSATLQIVTNPLSASGTLTNSAGTFDANGKAVTTGGVTTVSGGTYLAKTGTQTHGGLTISGGTYTGVNGDVDVNGDLNLSGGTLTATTGGFTVSGDWNKTGGAFTPGTGTVTFDGSADQTITSDEAEFNNFTVNKLSSSTLMMGDDLTVNRNFNLLSGGFDTDGYDLTIKGSYSQSGGAFFARNSRMEVGGNFFINGGNFDAADSTLVLSSLFRNGFDGEVYSLTTYGNYLIAGGHFTVAADTTEAGVAVKNIAKWDGSTWSSLGEGLDGDDSLGGGVVLSLLAYGNDLIAGGFFSRSGSTALNSIARWNGSTWSAIGTGFGDGTYENYVQVAALINYKGDLIASGYLPGQSHVAKWNGSSWSALGGGTSGYAPAMAQYGDDLVVGGQFATAGGTAVANIAKWNGSTWSALGSGITDQTYQSQQVRALTTYQGNLIVGGNFTHAGGVSAQNLAQWDGSSWSSLSGGVSEYGQIVDLEVYQDKLIVGGTLTHTGGDHAKTIAEWNGSTWSDMDGGLSHDYYYWNSVNALGTYGDQLVAGGFFNKTSEGSANGIAKWNGQKWQAYIPSATISIYGRQLNNLELRYGVSDYSLNGIKATESNLKKILTGELKIKNEVYRQPEIDTRGVLPSDPKQRIHEIQEILGSEKTETRNFFKLFLEGGREMRQINLRTGVNVFSVDPSVMGLNRGMEDFQKMIFEAQAAPLEQRNTLDQTLKTGTVIQNVTGNVRVVASDGKIYDAKAGVELQEGDQVITDKSANVELVKGADKVTVSEGSAVQVQKQAEEGKPVQDLLTLAFGQVSIAVSEDSVSSFVVQTPTGISGQRG